MPKFVRFCAGSLMLLALSMAIFAQSQATTGVIQGNVVDPNGASVAGASVNVKNLDTGFERTVTSNSDGLFSAPLLPLGRYRVTTSASGFTRGRSTRLRWGISTSFGAARISSTNW